MARLDASLWKPSPLGTVGPTGFLGAGRGGLRSLVYLPFRDYHLTEPNLPARAVAALRVLHGRAAIVAEPFLAETTPGRLAPVPFAESGRWLAVVAHADDGAIGSFLVAYPYPPDDRLAMLHYLWTARTAGIGPVTVDHVVRDAMWFTFLHELASDRYLGVVTRMTDMGKLARVERRVEPFRSVEAVVADAGYGR